MKKCELCELAATCGHYCKAHHDQVCIRGESPAAIRKRWSRKVATANHDLGDEDSLR